MLTITSSTGSYQYAPQQALGPEGSPRSDHGVVPPHMVVHSPPDGLEHREGVTDEGRGRLEVLILLPDALSHDLLALVLS